jgi:hypothetical protein
MIIGFFILLLIVDWSLYFRHAGHFFQGDSVYLLSSRAASIADFFVKFTKRELSGFYRPLSHIESILYPIFGLHPAAYHYAVYAAFAADTIAVYMLVRALTRRRMAAAIATFFFSIHTVNAYATYDIGFTPELFYAFFYMAAVLAYLRYIETGAKAAHHASLACFILSLLSKESAVTLPATLFVLYILIDSRSEPRQAQFMRALRSTLPHMLILMAYLAFALGHLHVMNIYVTRLLYPPKGAVAGSYSLAFNGTMLTNADVALTWAFNIPRGRWGQWQHLTPAGMAYLKIFRWLVAALSLVLLIRSERKTILIGAAWFAITLLPALPLLNHLIPYYLFLPIVGLSLVVGAVFTWTYDVLRRRQPVAAAAIVVMIFAGMLYVTNRSIGADIRDNRLLGGSADLAFRSLTDLKRMYPVLPAQTTIYFDDAEEPLYWEHNYGGLIKMAYNQDQINTLYASNGDAALISDRSRNPIVLGIHDKHLVDETSEYLANPKPFVRFIDSTLYKLDVHPADVDAGRGRYSLAISGLHDVPVRIVYSLNDDPVEVFTLALDAQGQITFDVSSGTKKGRYKFLGFNIAGHSEWIRADKTVTVH